MNPTATPARHLMTSMVPGEKPTAGRTLGTGANRNSATPPRMASTCTQARGLVSRIWRMVARGRVQIDSHGFSGSPWETTGGTGGGGIATWGSVVAAGSVEDSGTAGGQGGGASVGGG